MATREELKQVFANGQMATGEKFANLIDSMKVVQLPVVDPVALGTSLSFIDSISQDADGKITATKKTLDLANAHELNPFKGWWKTGDTLPTSGFDGAYLYFKDTTQTPAVTTIYQWNGTAYVDTGTEVDESNVNTFGSGQALNTVKIKDENGEEVYGAADVLSAEAGKEMYEGISSETISTITPSIKSDMYVNPSNVVKSYTPENGYYRIAYFPARETAWTAKVKSNGAFNGSYPIGCIFLVDDIDNVVNNYEVPSGDTLQNGYPTGSMVTFDKVVNVPAGKVLCVGDINYGANVFTYQEVQRYIDVVKNDDIAPLESNVQKGVQSFNVLDMDYMRTGEPLEVGTTFSNLYISKNAKKITTAGNNVFKIYCYAASSQERHLRVNQYITYSSLAVGGIFLVDDTSEIVANTTIPASDILLEPNTVVDGPKTIDIVVLVPAGRVLCISVIEYQTSYCNVYNTIADSQRLVELENGMEGLPNEIIGGYLSVDSVPDASNPLAFVKETAGYTPIFRKMGVIGGSMSSGEVYHTNGKSGAEQYGNGGVKDFYDCSTIQFMARLCGAEAFNFSSGGIGARSWVANTRIGGASDLFHNNPCQMYLIQLGNNDLGYHNEHSSYTLGNLSDVAGNNGVFADTFYGNMGAILQKIREVQPRAYVFLSTFLKGYGDGSNSDGRPGGSFDYNQAIRNIVEYYTENNGANRPAGDRLHYYLVDYYTYGKTYSYYINSSGSYSSHLSAAGYLMWAYQYCTYIDWIIKKNFADFFEVPFVGYWGVKYNFTNVIASNGAKLVEVNGSYSQLLQGKPDPNHTYTINSVTVTMGGVDITNEAWNSSTGMVTIDEVTEDVVITATAVEE